MPEARRTGYCPGGPGVNVNNELHWAECPVCGVTFSTMMDEPVFPPHYIAADGVTVHVVGR